MRAGGAGWPCLAASKGWVGPPRGLGVHQGNQLCLLLGQLLLPDHEVALALGQLALHVRQPLQGLGKLVALLLQGSLLQGRKGTGVCVGG